MPNPQLRGSPAQASGKKSTTSLGAFSISVLAHGAILLIVGGSVIFEGIIPKSPFILAEGTVEATDSEVLPPTEEPQDSPTISEMAASNETPASGEATSSDIIVSTGSNPSFTLPPAVGLPTTIPKLGFGSGTSGNSGGKGTGLPKMTLFGLRGGSGSGLKGQLYDLKLLANGTPSEMYPKTAPDRMESSKGLTEMIPQAMNVFQTFIKSWDTSVLAKYFSPPDSLVATQIFIPNAPALDLPKAFGLEGKVKPGLLVMHYKATITSPRTGTFRFVGVADDFLVVSINGKNVLDASYPPLGLRCVLDKEAVVDTKVGRAYGRCQLVGGKWFDLAEGQSYEIQIILGDEGFGGEISSFLLIQEKGTKYTPQPDDPKAPLLPVFKVTTNSPLPPYEVGKTGPPVAQEPLIFKISSSPLK